ncbi:MAG: hypothetical protein LBC63_08260 [Holophagales bacterium]|jgi:uncharacterized membrane protein|nr:hypothetical protein [Holophagales bacterium]
MAKIKHLYWKLFVSWLKDNIATTHDLACCTAMFYFSCCFERGLWLYGPRHLNLADLAYVVIVYCYSLLYLLWWKLTGKRDAAEE